MAFQKGNQHAAKDRLWRAAILRALELRSRVDQVAELDRIAAAMLTKAGEGDMAAIKELGDRLDGKPAQAVEMGGLDGGPLEIIARWQPSK